jgi:hypothetical protein
MLIGQSVLLGFLVDYFSDVSSAQVREDCFGVDLPGQYSARDAYLAAFGESYPVCYVRCPVGSKC